VGSLILDSRFELVDKFDSHGSGVKPFYGPPIDGTEIRCPSFTSTQQS